MTLLDQKIALVTGGAQGIGLAIAERFVDEGASVVIVDRDGPAAQAAAAVLVERATASPGPDGPPRAIGLTADVTDPSAVDRAAHDAVDTFGRIDVLVNNAGITRDATMRNMTFDDFRLVLDVHLGGAWLCTKAVAPFMRQHNSGSIVNISSIAGKVGNIGQTNYAAAKAGLIGLSKASAKEFARDGVRVNAIQPGLIRTPMTEAMPQTAWDSKMAEIPMQRAGEPSEVASCALFLASDLSSYVTGSVLEVTGGRYM